MADRSKGPARLDNFWDSRRAADYGLALQPRHVRVRQCFAENDIDVSVLSHLTDQDLKELGVSLGHRRKILAAIAELARGAVPTSPSSALTEPKPKDTAERRQVTVMFSDLVGSTILSARMDPEDLREVIAVYHKCVAEIVRSSGGFVAQYLG